MARTDEEIFEDVWSTKGKRPMVEHMLKRILGEPVSIETQDAVGLLKELHSWRAGAVDDSVWGKVDAAVTSGSPAMPAEEVRSFMRMLRTRSKATYTMVVKGIPAGKWDELVPDIVEDRKIDAAIGSAVTFHSDEKDSDAVFNDGMKKHMKTRMAYAGWHRSLRRRLLLGIRWPFRLIDRFLTKRIDRPFTVFTTSEMESGE